MSSGVEFGRVCDTELAAYKELLEHLAWTGWLPGVLKARVIYYPDSVRKAGWWLELASGSAAAKAHAKHAFDRVVAHCPTCGEHIEVGQS